MIYDSLGNMAAQVMPNRERRKYAAAEPTPEEAKAAITGYLAYFGTYAVDEQARTVIHHRKGNINLISGDYPANRITRSTNKPAPSRTIARAASIPVRLTTPSSGPTCLSRTTGSSSPLQGARTRSCGSGLDNLFN
jgi:hypothetical protein